MTTHFTKSVVKADFIVCRARERRELLPVASSAVRLVLLTSWAGKFGSPYHTQEL